MAQLARRYYGYDPNWWMCHTCPSRSSNCNIVYLPEPYPSDGGRRYSCDRCVDQVYKIRAPDWYFAGQQYGEFYCEYFTIEDWIEPPTKQKI